MPNIPQQETIVQYVANSSQPAYTFAFYAPLETDIEVYYQASNATPIPASDILNLYTDYTVTFNSDPITGGTITLLFTPTTGYYLTINRNVAASLNTNFAAAQTLSGQTLDTAFDRLLLLCQQNQNYALERNLSYIINTYLPNASPYTQLPPLAENFIWIGSGAGITSAEISEVPSASLLRSQLANQSPGTAGALLVGYYDTVNSAGTTVSAFLDNLPSFINDVKFSKYYSTGGTGSALTLTIPGYTSYTTGDRFFIYNTITNTGFPTTLNINGIGAIALSSSTAVQSYPGDLAQGTFSIIEYNGSGFVVLNPNSMLQRLAVYGSVSLTIDQAFPNGMVFTLVNFDTVNFESSSFWNNTSKRFVAPYDGMYRVDVNLLLTHGDPATTWSINLFKNGSFDCVISGGNYSTTGTPDTNGNGTTLVPLSAGDYVDIQVRQGGASSTSIRGSLEGSYFEIEYVGR